MATNSVDLRVLQPASTLGVRGVPEQVHEGGAHQWVDSGHLRSVYQWVSFMS